MISVRVCIGTVWTSVCVCVRGCALLCQNKPILSYSQCCSDSCVTTHTANSCYQCLTHTVSAASLDSLLCPNWRSVLWLGVLTSMLLFLSLCFPNGTPLPSYLLPPGLALGSSRSWVLLYWYGGVTLVCSGLSSSSSFFSSSLLLVFTCVCLQLET